MMTTTHTLGGGQIVGTITPQFGNSAMRNGFKLIEIYETDTD